MMDDGLMEGLTQYVNDTLTSTNRSDGSRTTITRIGERRAQRGNRDVLSRARSVSADLDEGPG